MLHKFLLAEREGILALCAEKILRASDSRSSSKELGRGLPIFYDELIEVLRKDEEESREPDDEVAANLHRASAGRHGKESLRLGYTISQVVHGYGSLCQAITEYSSKHGDHQISSREFNRLNFCLDVVIAEAVTEFSQGQRDATAREEVQRLGYIAHELRNGLASVAAAHRIIQRGLVGVGGSTSHLLEDALGRMKDIIDRSLSEVRLRGEPTIERRRCRVIDLVGEVEVLSAFEAHARSVHLHIEVGPDLIIDVDRHLMLSAISNLIQNAIKFTAINGNVWVRTKVVGNRIYIEIEDECGGLPPGKIEELFQPFTQKGVDRKGLGLGLSISKRAVELNDGQVSARDILGTGCIFTINLPQAFALPGEAQGCSLI